MRDKIASVKEETTAIKASMATLATKEELNVLAKEVAELRAEMREANASRESQFKTISVIGAGILIAVVASAIID